MLQRSSIFWQGQPLHGLSRERLERAAEQAIAQLMQSAEQEKRRDQQELIMLAFIAGAVLASLGGLLGLFLSR